MTEETPKSEEKPFPEAAPPIVRPHSIKVGGKKLDYFTTSGMMPLKNDKGETEANIFFTAYTLGSEKGDPNRPLMFSFNGGPGSASVWLHMGGLAPKRVQMVDDGAMPAPPFKIIDNDFTWLEHTDLVFLDPVETGYSRAASPELTKKFNGVDGDLTSVGEFIRLYLTRYSRWISPLFLVGESYGTFRAAGLAGLLVDKGIAFNGIVLVSSVLSMLTLRFQDGNDLPHILYLPSFAATAWYHGKLSAEVQARGLDALLAEVEAWTANEYAAALAKGSRLQGAERASVVDKLAYFTGLSKRYIEQSNLRIEIMRFCKELAREDGKTVGRLDSRYTGFDSLGVSERPDFDPSLAAIRPPFTSTINQYIRTELGFESDTEYHILRSLEWNWGNAAEGFAKTASSLSDAFARNPYLNLFIASGFYDLATPYFATDYTIDHLQLTPAARNQITTEKYPVGHMVYLEIGVLQKLRDDVARFIAAAIATPSVGLK